MQTFLLVSHNQDFIEKEIEKKKNSLDVLSYNLHEIKAENSIGIDQVRQLKEVLSRKPYGGGNRLVIIRKMEKATHQAANALLKLLEEPPEKTYITLATKNANLLLPTIISRCQVVTEKNIISKDYSKEIKEVKEILKKILKGSPGERILLSQKLAKSKEEALKLLDDFIILLRQLLYKEDKDVKLEPKELASLIKKVTAARHYLERNVNYKATLDVLFLGFPKDLPKKP